MRRFPTATIQAILFRATIPQQIMLAVSSVMSMERFHIAITLAVLLETIALAVLWVRV